MDTNQENTPQPSRGLSDQAAVDMMLTPEEPREAPKGQAKTDSSESADSDPQAIGQAQAPPVDESEEQATDSLLEEDGDEPDQEQEATDEDDPEATDSDDEHSEESAEETESREVSPDDVIFHDPEGNPVTAEEAHRGYLRQADYTRKTQEIAQQKQQVEALVAERSQERQVMAEHINMALNVVEPTLAKFREVDWDRLATESPHEYARAKAQYEQASERYLKLKQAGEQTVQQAQQEQSQKLQQHLKVQDQIAQRLIPELADPKKAPQVKQRLGAYLMKGAGFSQDEVAKVSDARLLNLAHKALQYDLMQARNKQVRDKKVRTAPKAGMKPGSPKTQAQRQERAKADQMAKLRKTGNIKDAVDLLLKKS